MKLVSVVIINYNTYQLTCACIQSILQQTKEVTYEVILVDNASTEIDADQFVTQFPDLVLIKNPINVGFAKGCNLGLSVAKGKYVLLLNSDAELKNEAIEICTAFLASRSDVGVVTGRITYPNGQIQHNCQRFPSIRYQLFELLRLQKVLPRKIAGKILFGPFFTYQSIAFPDWVWGTFFMFRSKDLTLFPNGRLADDFFMYVEDMQWCMDFRRAGFRIAFEPRAEVIHHLGKSSGASGEFIAKNTAIFMDKNYSMLHKKLIFILKRILDLTLDRPF